MKKILYFFSFVFSVSCSDNYLTKEELFLKSMEDTYDRPSKRIRKKKTDLQAINIPFKIFRKKIKDANKKS